jgi:hypothetical protein
LAFKMSGNCHFQIKWLDNPEYKKMVGRIPWPVRTLYQVSIHLAKRFQRRQFFRNQPIRNKNCLWRPCLLMDLDEMCNLYRGLVSDRLIFNILLLKPFSQINRNLVGSIYGRSSASYQVSVNLAKWFQRRRI